MTNVVAASELLKPYDASLMQCYPVSTRINHVAHDDGAMLRFRWTEADAESAVLVVSRKSRTSQTLACWRVIPVTAAHAQFLR